MRITRSGRNKQQADDRSLYVDVDSSLGKNCKLAPSAKHVQQGTQMFPFLSKYKVPGIVYVLPELFTGIQGSFSTHCIIFTRLAGLHTSQLSCCLTGAPSKCLCRFLSFLCGMTVIVFREVFLPFPITSSSLFSTTQQNEPFVPSHRLFFSPMVSQNNLSRENSHDGASSCVSWELATLLYT